MWWQDGGIVVGIRLLYTTVGLITDAAQNHEVVLYSLESYLRSECLSLILKNTSFKNNYSTLTSK